MIPDDRLYTAQHEWLKVEDGEAVLGITDFAQQELGDVVFVELPAAGQEFRGRIGDRSDRVGQGGRGDLHARRGVGRGRERGTRGRPGAGQ